MLPNAIADQTTFWDIAHGEMPKGHANLADSLALLLGHRDWGNWELRTKDSLYLRGQMGLWVKQWTRNCAIWDLLPTLTKIHGMTLGWHFKISIFNTRHLNLPLYLNFWTRALIFRGAEHSKSHCSIQYPCKPVSLLPSFWKISPHSHCLNFALVSYYLNFGPNLFSLYQFFYL